jgi:hypothetical protein
MPADARVAKGKLQIWIAGVTKGLKIIRMQVLGRNAVPRHHPHIAVLKRKGGTRFRRGQRAHDCQSDQQQELASEGRHGFPPWWMFLSLEDNASTTTIQMKPQNVDA